MADFDTASVHSDATVESHPAYPFIDDDADVVLRSGDGVDFGVHKIIMSKASPFFRDMFSLPQSPDAGLDDGKEFVDGKPLIECVEDSKTLRLLLLFIYPGEDPSLDDITEISGVLEASVKYDSDFIAAKVRQRWTEMVHTDPLRAYAIACLRKWPREALAAARSALKEPVWPLEPPLCSEYDFVSGNTVLRLEQYHRACASAARDLALQGREQWLQVLSSQQCEHCNNASRHAASRHWLGLTNWMNKYLSMVADELAVQPAPETVKRPNFINSTIQEAYEASHPCEFPSYVMETISHFVRHFATKLEVVLCGVDLTLEF